MGSTQLLLLVLAIILIAIAFVVGANLFRASAAEANEDAIISDLLRLATIAKSYCRLPVEMGGGGNSFKNFIIPAAFLQTENGTIKHIKKGHKKDHIHFKAIGNEIGEDGINPVKFKIRVSGSKIKLIDKNEADD